MLLIDNSKLLPCQSVHKQCFCFFFLYGKYVILYLSTYLNSTLEENNIWRNKVFYTFHTLIWWAFHVYSGTLKRGEINISNAAEWTRNVTYFVFFSTSNHYRTFEDVMATLCRNVEQKSFFVMFFLNTGLLFLNPFGLNSNWIIFLESLGHPLDVTWSPVDVLCTSEGRS